MQKFAILYPVGASKHLAYRVCYSEGPERIRIATITADHSRTKGHRILRTQDPEVWAQVRTALLSGSNIIYSS